MDQARGELGTRRTNTRFMYNGPGAHVITYPVAMDTLLNVLVVISDPNPWLRDDGKHTAQGSKNEVIESFRDWHPTVRTIVDLLPEELDKWAIFDMLDHPAASYVKSCTCVAGDAAHAAGPHLGSGAGFGIEDGLALATVLGAVKDEAGNLAVGQRQSIIREAFLAYNDTRYERTQWLVRNTRDAVDLFQWRLEGCGSDPEKFASEITWRFHKIWEYDVDGMVAELSENLRDRLGHHRA
jgi:salicylate hydroxylase